MNRMTEVVRAQIRADREQMGFSLSRIMEKYHLPRSTAFYTIRDCDSSKVIRKPRGKRVVAVQHKPRPSLSKTDLGEASRQMICARLMLSGIKVFRPMTEDTSVDLLVLRRDNTTAKCQCKYLFPDHDGRHVLNCFSGGRGTGKGRRRHIYAESEVDFFLGFCLDDDSVYVVPRKATLGKNLIFLWIMREPMGECHHKRLDTKTFKNNFDCLR